MFKIIHKFVSKVICSLLPILGPLRLRSFIISSLAKIRLNINRNQNFTNILKKLSLNRKILLLDVGAEKHNFNSQSQIGISEKYESFFDLVIVEPNPSSAAVLKKKYTVIEKGLWSSNCNKTLYITGKNSGASSMYKPWKEGFDLFNPYGNFTHGKYFSNLDITEELSVECSTIKESLTKLNKKELDYLKLVTQGAEYEILKGIGNYFPLFINVQVLIYPMYKDVPQWTEMLDYLYKLDYMLCSWNHNDTHTTQTPVISNMYFVPNFLTSRGRQLILSREKEFIFLMLATGQIRLLQLISKKLKFSLNQEISEVRDKFFD
ncbi:FkbM family methyltransferase [Pelagibacteraceae bacterium]|nr:FkbM family methyltransferase [Pelagibacteraceae bacterium]